ncbi:MAG: hypothetical protein WC656_01390 [Sulfurimonas sp.]
MAENLRYEETVSGNLVLDYNEEDDNYRLYLECNNNETIELETLFEYDHAVKVFNRTLKYYK